MRFWKSISGVLEVELTSAEPEIAVCALSNAGIEISHMKQAGDLSRRFLVTRSQFDKAVKIVNKRGERLRVLRRTGICWILAGLSARFFLIAGFIILLILAVCVPKRILFVEVEGNVLIADNRILEAAEECGIRFGADRREVRSEKVKNALLAKIPQLQWAGINTTGCTAVISVEERLTGQEIAKDKSVSRIVAARDGYILSGTVFQGSALFQPGQTVQEGQTLISGYVDCGSHIQVVKAEGEIHAQTNRNLDVVMPSFFEQRGNRKTEYKKISLLLRKKRINLWEDSGILDSTCGRMYKEYYITLPGGFRLPFGICVETYVVYETRRTLLSREEAERCLTEFAQNYLTEQMIAGSIQSQTQQIEQKKDCFWLKGSYICTEMIGREQKEQIGEKNGQSD